MNLKNHIIYLCIAQLMILFQFSVQAQQELAIGAWQLEIPKNRSYALTQNENYIFEAMRGGILKIDKQSLETSFISKIDGLTETNPIHLHYDPSSNMMMVLYASGNFDLIHDTGIRTITDISTNDQLGTNKRANRIRPDETGTALICFPFGLVQYDILNRRFGFSLFTDFEIYDVLSTDQYYYLASAQGIYRAEKGVTNYVNIDAWQHLRNTHGFPFNYSSVSVQQLEGAVYCDVNGMVYRMPNENSDAELWIDERAENLLVRTMHELNNHMGIIFRKNTSNFQADHIYLLDASGTTERIIADQRQVRLTYDIIQDQFGQMFTAEDATFTPYFEDINAFRGLITTEGPYSNHVSDVFIDGDTIFVAPGEVNDKLSMGFNRDGYFKFIDQQWQRFRFDEVLTDYHRILKNDNQDLVIATYDDGMIRQTKSGEVIYYNDENSCLDIETAAQIRTRIGDIELDERGGIWLTNNRADNPLKYFDRDWNCSVYNPGYGNEYTQLSIDQRGYIWIATHDNATGFIVYDPGDLNDPMDDRSKGFSSSNSSIPQNKVWDIAVDLDGDIWVGTDQGMVVFTCDPFNDNCTGRTPTVDVDGSIAYLLSSERCRALAIDGGNRKWVGTENGIFVIEANSNDLLTSFNITNSPLISNRIISIDMNPSTGEVYIGTAEGLMIYKTDATFGDPNEQVASEVLVYPNPVRPGYNGPIAIKGLARDATIQITDIQGQLIFEGEANGGEAIWNGMDYNGVRASTGVYLLYSSTKSNFEKPNVLVAKILIVD